METHVGRLIQDQNLYAHYNGAPKSNISKAQKKGGAGGRKAFNDISNSGNPSALQASGKHGSIDVISIGEDLGISKTAFSVGGKTNVSKAPEKSQAGGRRKALSDLTNLHQVSKKTQAKKLSSVVEENLPNSIGEEGFLHNHQECIKAQGKKALDMEYFLKTVGLDNDKPVHSASPWVLPVSRNSNPDTLNLLEMEEISELMTGHNSPICGSPRSPKADMHWMDYNFSDFILMESPVKN